MVLAIMLLAPAPVLSWNLAIYPDSDCESTPSANYNGDGGSGCIDLTASRRAFEFDNPGNCILTLYGGTDCNLDDLENFYDIANAGQCIPPQFEWNSFEVGC